METADLEGKKGNKTQPAGEGDEMDLIDVASER
jgi:hypothetical protein